MIAAGGRGLGLEVARELGDRGCKLVYCAHDLSTLRSAHRELEARGFEVVAMRCDIETMFATARSTFGRVDILVNDEVEAGPLERAHRSEQLDRMVEKVCTRTAGTRDCVIVTTVYRGAVRSAPMRGAGAARRIVRAIARRERFIYMGPKPPAANGRTPAPGAIERKRRAGTRAAPSALHGYDLHSGRVAEQNSELRYRPR